MKANYWKKNLPNWLTISRVVVIVPICILLSFPATPFISGFVLLLSAYAMITDYFDGYLSRKWDVVSNLGRLLDPIADKLLVAALLIMLSAQGIGHPLAVTLIMLREIFISGLREFMQEHNIVIHVTTLAKYKTATQMLACFLLLLSGMYPNTPVMLTVAEAILWIAALLTCVTAVDYARGAMKHYRSAR